MVAKKIIKSVEDVDLEIFEITLLSKEEYEKGQQYIPFTGDWWWLRSHGNDSDCAVYVSIAGAVNDNGTDVDNDLTAVRPALRIKNLESYNLKPGEEIVVAGREWTVISEDLAIANSSIGYYAFRYDSETPDASEYEQSDVKEYIDNWARENGIELAG